MQQFDENTLKAILALPDEQLWQLIKTIALQNGVKLPTTTPPRQELDKLRTSLGTNAPNVNEALQIVNQYKKEHGV